MRDTQDIQGTLDKLTLLEGKTPLLEGRYWDNKGRFEDEAQELQDLVGPSGPSETVRGEIFRAAMKIYYDYYNNGFGNEWPAVAQFLMNNVRLSDQAQRMLHDHAMGIMHHDEWGGVIEEMLDTTIKSIYDIADRKNTTDMWDTSYNQNDFAAYDDDEDDYDDEEESWFK